VIHPGHPWYVLAQVHWQRLPGSWRESVGAVMSAVANVNISDPHQPLPAFIVARNLGVSQQLLRSWVASGKLRSCDQGADGRPLYRLVDAAEVEKQMRDDPRSSRRRCPVGAAA